MSYPCPDPIRTDDGVTIYPDNSGYDQYAPDGWAVREVKVIGRYVTFEFLGESTELFAYVDAREDRPVAVLLCHDQELEIPAKSAPDAFEAVAAIMATATTLIEQLVATCQSTEAPSSPHSPV